MSLTVSRALALARAAQGPLAPHLEAFASSLIEQQYSAFCLNHKLYRAVHFSAWIGERGFGSADIDEALVARYLKCLSRRRASTRRSARFDLLQLLPFLRERGVIGYAPTHADPVDEYIVGFEQHLRQVRGLAPRTIVRYAELASTFLRARFGRGRVDLRVLLPSDVIEHVQRQVKRMAPRQVKLTVTALRSLLDHAQVLGAVTPQLVAAVPAVASWATTPALPRAISAEHAQRALDSCNVATAVGRRDRAVLLLLARLGLRSGEVASLQLDDVDWRAGCLRVRGKGRRDDVMPLPADVGEALAAYVQHGRPVSDDRHIFLRARAPVRAFKNNAVAVASIVEHALQRAGVAAPHQGAHQFRHALAVRLLGQGASLPEIGEVLRHRSPQVTAVYARVDLAALRLLAPAWPGAMQ